MLADTIYDSRLQHDADGGGKHIFAEMLRTRSGAIVASFTLSKILAYVAYPYRGVCSRDHNIVLVFVLTLVRNPDRKRYQSTESVPFCAK